MPKPVLKIYDDNGVEIPIPAIVGKRGPTGPAGPNSVSTSTDSSITGLLKGDAGKVAQAIAGTDYVTPADLHAHSNKTALDAVSGTNTGDQDVSGAISTHNDDAGAHTVLARKTETMRRLISRTIGAGENASAITWTQDDAGNALSLIDAEIRIYVPANSIATGGNGYILGRINGVSSANSYFTTLIGGYATYVYVARYRTVFGSNICMLKKEGSRYCLDSLQCSFDGSSHSSGLVSQHAIFDATNINSIYLYVPSGYFPAGAAIEIYGRTA